MKKNKQQRLLTILSLICVCGILIYGIVNENARDTKKVQTQESFTTNEFISQLNYKQENLNNFIEKAIEIEGEIKEITYKNNKYSLILKGNENRTYIICEMQTDQSNQVLKLKSGENIKLKGILKGFLMDIILLNCIIID